MPECETPLPTFAALTSSNRDVFNAAWQKVFGSLYGVGIRVARRRLDADESIREDIVFEIIASIYRRIEAGELGFQETRQMLPYIHTAVENRVKDYFEKSRIERSRRGTFTAEVLERERVNTDPLNSLTTGEKRALLAAVHALPPPQPDIVLLHSYEGWSLREIARILKLPITRVRKLWHVALASLRRCLTSDF